MDLEAPSLSLSLYFSPFLAFSLPVLSLPAPPHQLFPHLITWEELSSQQAQKHRPTHPGHFSTTGGVSPSVSLSLILPLFFLPQLRPSGSGLGQTLHAPIRVSPGRRWGRMGPPRGSGFGEWDGSGEGPPSCAVCSPFR